MKDFDKVYDLNFPLVLSIVNELNIYKNREDYIQIGYIALWKAYNRFDERKGKFSSFAYKTIKGELLNELTRQNKMQVECSQQTVVNEVTMYDTYMVELENYLCSVKPLLTENQYLWLHFYVLEGKGPKDIAKLLNTTEAAVKSWRKRALMKLRTLS
ncbi:sigma-70 family RNA polymerase sigma factor [Bacillus carboniphilus]|uniref:Sigma-70 family RNA polymerase sigma factor n=1 Tax=Bacillus carboniphilus TaxID=86663 RepID=A0ABY9JUU4_9BACI|nr:sigma-70 family RNA polymerase sigma factor [Bacillus carboniphilus]WLR43152.1 sigma-70 family RNA polymerase sigma factor [Bacillus carboniphilus]